MTRSSKSGRVLERKSCGNCLFFRGLATRLPYNGAVLILALDTSSPAGSVAVLRDGKVIGVVSTWVDEIYSSRMFRHLDFLLRELALSLDQFDVFAVAAGPGSFTGLRVGLAAVKGWAEVYGQPVAAVSALEAVAVQGHSAGPFLVPVLDARRSQVYYGFYDVAYDAEHRSLKLDGEECVASPAEFLEALRSRGISQPIVVSPVPELVASMLVGVEPGSEPHQRIRVETVSATLAPVIGQLGFVQAQRGELVDALSLNANYVRRSDAELHWKEFKNP
jgi:tRNA threonylcarbamoyladenosine biosynthesis protein TsaB